MQRLRVHFLAGRVAEEELVGSTVVVIDVLRASTTICQALASGATAVVPLLEVADALAAARAAVDRRTVVLGGERGGLRIAEFDLGNSPAEYTPKAVRGKCVLLTTTNGTRALCHARRAKRVVVGAVVNLSAVAASVQDAARVDVLCAGTDGQETGEDVLTAGGIVHKLCSQSSADWYLNDAAAIAAANWSLLNTKAQAARRSQSEQLAIELRATPGGRNLLAIGLDDDLVDCAGIDALTVVPELDTAAWRITLP